MTLVFGTPEAQRVVESDAAMRRREELMAVVRRRIVDMQQLALLIGLRRELSGAADSSSYYFAAEGVTRMLTPIMHECSATQPEVEAAFWRVYKPKMYNQGENAGKGSWRK